RADQPGVRVAEQVDRDPGSEIEIAGAVLGDQVGVFAAYVSHAAPGIDGHQRSNRHGGSESYGERESANDEWRPPSTGSGGRRLCPFMVLAGPGQTAGPGWERRSRRRSALNGHKVDRRELSSSVDLEIELEAVAFVDPGQARTLDRADMDERVFLAVVARDEAEALHRVEELDRARGLVTGQLALRPGRPLLHRNDVSDDLQVGGGNLASAIDQVELQLLPLGEAFKARALDLADMDEHVLTALVALDEAETLLRREELHLAPAGADDLRGHPAAARRTAAIAAEASGTRAAEAAAAAARSAVRTAEAIAAAPPVITSEARRATVREGIETLLSETVPLVAPPAATTSIVTHLPNLPSSRPRSSPGDAGDAHTGRKRGLAPLLQRRTYSLQKNDVRTF